MIKNSKFSILRIIDYIIILLVILNSGFALTTGLNDFLLYSQIVLLGLVIVANGRYFRIPKYDFRQLAILLIVLSMIVALIVNMDTSAKLTYLHCALYIAIAYLINLAYDSNVIISVFLKVMLVVSIASVVVSVLNFIVPFSSYSLVVKNGSNVQYYTIGIVNFIKSTFNTFPRCCGIFWEPGLYAGFLGLAALFDLIHSEDNKNIFRVVIYCIDIFFSYSTAGYLYIIMIILLAFSQRLNNIAGTIVLGLLGVLLTVAFLNIDLIIDVLIKINPNVFSKIFLKNASYLTRSISPLADFSIIFNHPLGVGYGNIQRIRVETIKDWGTDISLSTSTLTYHGASCGFLFLIVYNVLWIKNFLVIKKNILFKILSFLLFIMVLTSNPLYNNQFIWVFLFFAFPQVGQSVGFFSKKHNGDNND